MDAQNKLEKTLITMNDVKEIYLDNSATTRVFPAVADLMTRVMLDNYGNPSSMHHKGVEAEKLLRNAKDIFASILKCDLKNIYFTSGGTESDNIAIIGAATAAKRRGMHLITTQIEHPAVINTMKHLESEGYTVTYLPVDKYGLVELDKLKEAITPETTLVSIMHVNNEIGSMQNIAEIGALIKSCNPDTLFHVDAVQGFGKAPILPKKMNIDLLSVSSHKIHGPKGMGMLYVGDRVKVNPICFGGGQQNGLRSGTENMPGIAGMSKAAEMLCGKLKEDTDKLYALKARLIRGALALEGVQVNGVELSDELKTALAAGSSVPASGASAEPDKAMTAGLLNEEAENELMSAIRKTAPHIVSLSFPGIRAEVMLHTLENDGIYVSAGSACSTHKPEPSATLKAIGMDKALLECTLRFSMSVFTTEDDIDKTIKVLADKLPMLQKYTRR